MDQGNPGYCLYNFHGAKNAPYAVITFNSAPGITPTAVEAGLKSGQKNVVAVPGLADAAFSFSSGRGRGLTFLSGTVVCSIGTTVPTTAAGEEALARTILAG